MILKSAKKQFIPKKEGEMLDTIVLFKIALLAGAAGASQLIHGRLYVDQRDIIKRDTYRVTGWFFLGISALALVLLGIGQFLL